MNVIAISQEFNFEHYGQNMVQIGPEMAEKIGVQKTSKIGNCGPMVFASLDNDMSIKQNKTRMPRHFKEARLS